MTEDELTAILGRAYGELSVQAYRDDVANLIVEIHSLTTQLAVAQGTATAETHRAEERQARVAELERQALAEAENYRAREYAATACTDIHDALNKAGVRVGDGSFLQRVQAVIAERDALAKLVECANSFVIVGERGSRVCVRKWRDRWLVDMPERYDSSYSTREEAFDRAREMAKGET